MGRMAILPEYSSADAEMIESLASALFSREVVLEKTDALLEECRERAERFYASNQTNVAGKTLAMCTQHAAMGVVTERAVAELLGAEARPDFDLTKPSTYSADVVTPSGLRVEVKSFSRAYLRYCRLTYPDYALRTLRSHRNEVDAVVFASAVSETDDSWTVGAAWVLETEKFLDSLASPIGDDYVRFSPYGVKRLLAGDVFAVNPKYVDME